MKITNKFNLPEPVFLALTEDNYSRGDSNRSVTQLIDSPRARIQRSEMDSKVEEDVSDRIWIAMGNAIHLMFEKYAKGKYLPEERLFAEVDGWTISGAIDIQYNKDLTHVELTDYKCTSVWSVIFGKDDVDSAWAKQLNFYAWLAEQSKAVIVDKLKILVVLRDWRMRDAMNNARGDYPQTPIMELEIPLWSEDDRDNYVHDRVRIHQNAEFQRITGGVLPLCTDEERWKNPATYAVMKGKNKRAVRVLDTAEEADKYIDKTLKKEAGEISARSKQRIAAKENGKKMLPAIKANKYTVDERPSVPNRCAMGYCKIAAWCDQYQGELKDEQANQ